MITVQVWKASLFPVAGGHDHVVLGGPDGQPVLLLPGRGVQPGHAGSVRKPAAAFPQRQRDRALTGRSRGRRRRGSR